MSLNTTLRKRRKELSLTQAGIAKALGVSTPAVSKWEKGTAFPDITLLAPLARLLKIDLNTLLSFKEDLSKIEIKNFLNELKETFEEKGFEIAYQKAHEKIMEFPDNIFLISGTIPYLDNQLQALSISNKEYFENEIENYYKKLILSEDLTIKEIGISMLFSNFLRHHNYREAEKLIQLIPDQLIDKEQFLTQLYLREGDLAKSEKILRSKMLRNVLKIQQDLLDLVDIAVSRKDEKEIQRLDLIIHNNIKNFDLPVSLKYFIEFRLALIKHDREICRYCLQNWLEYLEKCETLDEVFGLQLQTDDCQIQFNLIQNYILNIDKVQFASENKEIDRLLKCVRDEMIRFI